MREIKFRGKNVKTGEWVYGYLIEVCGEAFIVNTNDDGWVTAIDQYDITYRKVIPDTVGQYTGCKDTNGKEVFEGDIVTENLFWDVEKKEIVYFEIFFEENEFNLKDKKGMIFEIGQEPTIIGNIHDNPEMLK